MVNQMSSSAKVTKHIPTSEEKDSKKIWITLPIKYSDILDILADDSPSKTRSNRKSVVIEKMIDEYLERHEKELNDDGKWDKIISVRKRATKKLEKSLIEKIQLIEYYIDNYPEFLTLKKIWKNVKISNDVENIDKIFHKISEKRKKNSSELDKILANI